MIMRFFESKGFTDLSFFFFQIVTDTSSKLQLLSFVIAILQTPKRSNSLTKR